MKYHIYEFIISKQQEKHLKDYPMEFHNVENLSNDTNQINESSFKRNASSLGRMLGNTFVAMLNATPPARHSAANVYGLQRSTEILSDSSRALSAENRGEVVGIDPEFLNDSKCKNPGYITRCMAYDTDAKATCEKQGFLSKAQKDVFIMGCVNKIYNSHYVIVRADKDQPLSKMANASFRSVKHLEKDSKGNYRVDFSKANAVSLSDILQDKKIDNNKVACFASKALAKRAARLDALHLQNDQVKSNENDDSGLSRRLN